MYSHLVTVLCQKELPHYKTFFVFTEVFRVTWTAPRSSITSHITSHFHVSMTDWQLWADRSQCLWSQIFLSGKPREVCIRKGGNASLSMKEIYGRNNEIVVENWEICNPSLKHGQFGCQASCLSLSARDQTSSAYMTIFTSDNSITGTVALLVSRCLSDGGSLITYMSYILNWIQRSLKARSHHFGLSTYF